MMIKIRQRIYAISSFFTTLCKNQHIILSKNLTIAPCNVKSHNMAILSNLCVYCGSSMGLAPVYEQAAIELGRHMANDGVRLIYGGASIGLMGKLARSVLETGGKITGIIPRFLVEREVMFDNVDECIITDDMHERKRVMFEKAEAFVALPGGIGTLEELIEMLTWAQLGQHVKPILIANINGFWNPLLSLLSHMEEQGFIGTELTVPYITAERPDQILPRLRDAIATLPQEKINLSANDSTIKPL